MSELYQLCPKCDGERFWASKYCIGCNGSGVIPYEPPADVQALAAELLATAAGHSDTMWEEDTIHYLNEEFAAQIAAFCEKREADLRAEVERLQNQVTEAQFAATETEEDNERLRDIVRRHGYKYESMGSQGDLISCRECRQRIRHQGEKNECGHMGYCELWAVLKPEVQAALKGDEG